jgi:hypothetical protein
MRTSAGSNAFETPMSPSSNYSSSVFEPRTRSSMSEDGEEQHHHHVENKSATGSSEAQINVRDGRYTVENKRHSSSASDDTLNLPKVPFLPVDLSSAEPATPTLQYASADTYPPVPAAGSTPPTGKSSLQEEATPKRESNKSKTSLLASSRKAGSKVVKATVVRPARAVTRVFRGGSRASSDDPNTMALRSSSSGVGEEVETIMARGTEGNQVLLHSTATTNGVAVYGTINGSYASADLPVPNLGRTVSGGSIHSNRSLVQESAAAVAATKNADWPVHSMESLTRQVVLVCVAYMMGAKYPEVLHYVVRITEFAVTAWITCVAILCLSFLQRRFPQIVLSERDRYNLILAGGTIVDEHDLVPRANSSETAPLLRHCLQTGQNHCQSNQAKSSAYFSSAPLRGEEKLEKEHLVPLSDESPSGERAATQEEMLAASQATDNLFLTNLEHPTLAPFYVIDAYLGERVFCNSATPHHISNEWFEMDLLCLIRTRDADDSSAVSGTPANDRISNYMRSKARRFEFQFRVKLKKRPVGKQVYFACELDEPIKMGIVTRAFVGAAMAFMKKTNPTFHYSITGSKEVSDGNWEKPHMSFTVEGSLDRLVVTKPDEKPPELGKDIHEAPESIKRRKKGILTDWNTEDTYTMALWSSYVDFLDWKVLNLPGIRPFSLSSVLGTQSINLTMYLIDQKRESDKHFRKDITEIIKLELSNEIMASCGPAATEWKKVHKQRQIQSSIPQQLEKIRLGRSTSDDSAVHSQELDAESSAVEDESAIDFENQFKTIQSNDEAMDEIEEVDEDVLTAAKLARGSTCDPAIPSCSEKCARISITVRVVVLLTVVDSPSYRNEMSLLSSRKRNEAETLN